MISCFFQEDCLRNYLLSVSSGTLHHTIIKLTNHCFQTNNRTTNQVYKTKTDIDWSEIGFVPSRRCKLNSAPECSNVKKLKR